MAKIKVLGNSIVIISSVKLEDFKKVEKYRPSALTLMGGEDGKEPIFRVGTKHSNISEYGVEFNCATRDDEKKAMLTMYYIAENEDADVKDDIIESLGVPLLNLEKIEAIIPTVIEEIDAERASVAAKIEVIQ